jgi:type IV pilus assembly protein PilN
MVKTIPDGVRLTSMKQAGEILTLEGVAESAARVASYMRNVDTSQWMGHTDLRKIENKSGTKDVDKKLPYLFSLDVKLRKPEDAEGDKAQDAKVAANPAATSPDAAPAAKADLGGQLQNASAQLVQKRADGTDAKPATPAAPATGEKK